MPVRLPTGTIALLFVAVGMLGCPAPTGRTRGYGDGGLLGPCSAIPTPDAFCGSPGETCDAYLYCAAAATYSAETCVCIGRQWSCTQSCNASDGGRLRDSTAGMCPATIVQDGTRCEASMTGLYCPSGFVTDCDGSYHRQYCRCDHLGWTCPAPVCDGGGADARPPADARPSVDASDSGACPARPSAGAVCTPGTGCWYEGGTGAACRTYCNCDDSARFVCVGLPCLDGSTGD